MVFTLDKLQFNPTGRDSYWISDCGDYKIHKKVRNTQETTITNYYPITMSEVDPLDTLPPFGFLNLRMLSKNVNSINTVNIRQF